MRPTVGIDGVCPPMCTMAEINNGTYSLTDIEMMNQAMAEMLDEAVAARERAIQNSKRK